MIVEDEIIVAKDIQYRLEKLGYEVAGMVSDGQSAIEQASRQYPDIILMDIRLSGGVDGIEAARRIHDTLHIPVIYLTAYADNHTLQRAKVTEPFGYIIKPIEDTELKSTIEVALYKHAIEARLRESEWKFRTIFENANDVIVYLDRRGKIRDINKKAYSMFGCKKHNLIGTNILKLPWFDGRTVKRIHGVLGSLEKNEPSIDLVELELKSTEKKRIFAEASITALTDKDSITGFLMVIRNISERKKMEQRLAHTLAQLRKEQRQLESLTKKIITAQEQERLYLASEIHDDLLQGIVAILYFFQMIDTSSFDEKARERKEKLVQTIKSTIERGRSLIREIEPIREQDIDLVKAIKNSIELRFAGTETTVQFGHPDMLPRLSSAVETNILRIVQEALMNIYKHANATSVNIRLDKNKKTLIIEIADNGAGFSKRTAAKKAAGHYGLLSMHERARLINGSLSIKSRLGKGTTIRCSFPIERSEYGWTK